jgi:hypothetical protein
VKKVLFIVNEHPNEAFAIIVARETAKLLRKVGYTVDWKKINAKDTVLGAILKSGKERKFSEADLYHINTGMQCRAVWNAMRESKASAVYRFHCTEPGSEMWKGDGGSDFKIMHFDYEPSFLVQLVEIKAFSKPMPKRILDII